MEESPESGGNPAPDPDEGIDYHVLRHSFASNLAAAGTEQRVIDELMGHTTEEMRKRYRHLFPEQKDAAVLGVYG
jgi:site-specific recombinase XerD